jgi:hypothetical protein
MIMKCLQKTATMLAVGTVISVAAHAGSVTYYSSFNGTGHANYSDPAAYTSPVDPFYVTTNFTNQSLTIPKFDASFGTLTSINILLTGFELGNASYESLDGSPTNVTLNLAATVTLFDPANNQLVVALPTFSNTYAATAFDGALDFGGTSGAAFTGLFNFDAVSGTFSSAGDLATFTGSGNIVLPVHALGNSQANGSGNLVTLFQNTASAQVQITYNYRDNSEAPEPATMGLFGSALVGLGLLGRKRFTR